MVGGHRGGRRSRTGFAAAAALATAVVATAGCGPAVTPATVQPAPPGAALTQANRAAIVVSANRATIERSRLARERAAGAEVRALADKIARDHEAVGQLLDQQLRAMGVVAQPEAFAMQIDASARQALQMMQNGTGMAVDHTYLAAEIAHHRWLLETLDVTVAPLAPGVAGERVVADLRTLLRGHLTELERLQGQMSQHHQKHHQQHPRR
jgi:predicted outer membrane protein